MEAKREGEGVRERVGVGGKDGGREGERCIGGKWKSDIYCRLEV